MPTREKKVSVKSRDQFAALAKQGRTWRFVEQVSKFKRPPLLLDPPMEITPAMIRGLRMVDETVVIHGPAPRMASTEYDRTQGEEK